MAHDLNNELTVILNSAAVLLTVTPSLDPRRQLLMDMEQAAMRIAYKTEYLQRFGARHGAQPGYESLELAMLQDEVAA